MLRQELVSQRMHLHTYNTNFRRPSDGIDQPVVAAGNIEVITDESLVHLDMFPVAGRFFKRFDRTTCRFIHNLEDEYPFL